MKSKFFITGGTGLLGSHILNRLLENEENQITAHCRELPSSESHSEIWIKGDLDDPYYLSKHIDDDTVVIHCAGMVNYNPRKRSEIIRVNESITADIVNICLEKNAKKLVYISSIAALGKEKPNGIIDENCMWSTSTDKTVYAESKFLGEQQAWRGYYEGLPTTIINPSIIFGVGDWAKSSLQMVSRIDRQSLFYPKGGSGYVDVVDVANAAVKAIDSNYDGKRFIISENNYTHKEIFTAIAKKLQVASPKYALNPSFLRYFALIEGIYSRLTNKDPLLTPQTIKNLSKISKYDNSLSIKALEIDYTPIYQTIDRMVNAYLKTKN